MANRFILPSSSVVLCQDRFDLLGSDEDEVPFWDLLTAILTSKSDPIQDIASLIEALETIALSLRGTATNENHDVLHEFMTSYLKDEVQHAQYFTKTWPFLVDLALDMPTLFPDGTLPCLSPVHYDNGTTAATFSRRQVACLVVHQFLCSLPPHPWDTESFVDLRPWYSQLNTSHPGAVHAYLTALFTYFENLQESIEGHKPRIDLPTDEWPITFTVRSIGSIEVDQLLESEASRAYLYSTSIEICHLEEPHTSPAHLGLPQGACVISANKCFGYGPTGTQEELHVGVSPESYPAVLFASPLSDDQVLICRGAEAMVSISGYGRDAKLDQVLPSSNCSLEDFYRWKDRTMLFMDALEMDILGAENNSLIPDIQPPPRISREMISKAYNAFRSDGQPYSHIVTGLWGCGAFGGNKYVKCLLQWCAASLAQIPVLKFVFSGSGQKDFTEDFDHFVIRMRGKNVTVQQIFEALAGMKDCSYEVSADAVFDYIVDQLGTK
jgi:poly(ADP-ribose) glycohydrolase